MTIRTDAGVIALARRIQRHSEEISYLIHQIKVSKHPHAVELADALREQCWFPAWAEHVIAGYLEHPERFETGDYGIRRKQSTPRKTGT